MQKTVFLIILFTLLQGIMHNIGHPVTPAFVRDLGIADYMFGVFFASMSFGLMIGGPIWGVLGDQGNQKRYIVIGLLLYSIGQFGFGYIDNAIGMVFFRLISGFGAVAAITLLTSILIASSTPETRAKHLAYMAAAFTLGTSFGYGIGGFISTDPTVSQLLGTFDYQRVFLVQSLGNALYALTVLLLLKPTLKSKSPSRASMIEGLKSLTKIDTHLLIFLIALMLMTIGGINLNKYIDVYFDELGYSPQDLGNFILTTGFVSLFASLFLVSKMAKIKHQLWVIGIIQTLSALIVFYVFRANAFLTVIYSVYMIYIVFRTIFAPLEQNYISNYAKESAYGSIMGLRMSFVSFGMVIGPLIGGFVYEIDSLLLFDMSAMFLLAGVILLMVIGIIGKKQHKELM